VEAVEGKRQKKKIYFAVKIISNNKEDGVLQLGLYIEINNKNNHLDV
jgi:hypothetical protein